MSKFLKLTVSKKLVTDIYVEVPDGFDPRKHRIRHQELQRLVQESDLDRLDWDDDNDVHPDYEQHGLAIVDEREATAYTVVKWDFPPGTAPTPQVPPWPENAIIPDPRCPAEALTGETYRSLMEQEACTTKTPS